ncbi:hypothetical protein L6452_25665 [Arctium lappa]|uniref:Uncharacterized protein n=1 Tax=Arctium lappa TaxID=4217 RepID=A0ACB9AC18_ARCLA|nr:hypothetical protein L6452_25665 [Arctium lappa]
MLKLRSRVKIYGGYGQLILTLKLWFHVFNPFRIYIHNLILFSKVCIRLDLISRREVSIKFSLVMFLSVDVRSDNGWLRLEQSRKAMMSSPEVSKAPDKVRAAIAGLRLDDDEKGQIEVAMVRQCEVSGWDMNGFRSCRMGSDLVKKGVGDGQQVASSSGGTAPGVSVRLTKNSIWENVGNEKDYCRESRKAKNENVEMISSYVAAFGDIHAIQLGKEEQQTPVLALIFIHFVLVISRQGKVRLTKWYSPYSQKERSKVIRELSGMILTRGPKLCNFVEWRGFTVVYKRYASLYFCMCINQEDNELEILEIIQYFVETLDRYFGSVCELDLIFHFDKAYYILDEILIAGELQESSKKTIHRLIDVHDSMVEAAKVEANAVTYIIAQVAD